MLAVVTIHLTPQLMRSYDNLPLWQWLAADVANALTRWCVPVFVMLSGAFLLDPSRDGGAGKFLRRQVPRVLIPTLFWSAFYLYDRWVGVGRPSGEGVKMALDGLLSGVPTPHLYFPYLILGLYLLTPPLRLFVRTATPRDMAYAIGLCLGVAMLTRGLSILGLVGTGESVFTQFIPYIGYYLAGFFLKDLSLSARQRSGLYILLLMAMGVAAVATAHLVPRFGAGGRGTYFFQYLSPTVVVMSLCVFGLFVTSPLLRDDGPVPMGFRRFIFGVASPASFGVYLIHPLVIRHVGKELQVRPTGFDSWGGPWVGIPLTLVLVVALSTTLVWGVQRVPYLRRLL